MEVTKRKANQGGDEGAALTQDPAPAAEPAVCPGPGLGDCPQTASYRETISEKSENALLSNFSTITATDCLQGLTTARVVRWV